MTTSPSSRIPIPFWARALWRRLLLSWLAAVFALLSAGSGTAEPYEPAQPLRITDPWRWHELEPLSAYNLHSGTEGIDGLLYFASDNEIVVYDGYDCRSIPYPAGVEKQITYQIEASRNGLIYLLTMTGLYSYGENGWKTVRAVNLTSSARMARFARSPFGLEIVALPDGLYQIIGYDLKRIAQVKEAGPEILFDKNNRLWLLETTDNVAVSYQFDQTGLQQPVERREYQTSDEPNLFPRLIASPLSGKVWTVNWKQLRPPQEYSIDEDKWIPQDLSHLTGNNEHITGFIPQKDEVVIFTKTAILAQSKGQWHTLRYPDFNIPTNQPFHLKRMNGNLIIGGHGEKVFQIAYANEPFDSFAGLHFQCDDQNGHQWFISVDGAIVEHDPETSAWTKHTQSAIDSPVTLFTSEDNRVWAAGSHQGTAAVSSFDGARWDLQTHPELADFISYLSACQLSDGRIVFGSGDEEPKKNVGGLIVYTKGENGYTFSHKANPYAPSRIVSIVEDADHSLLAGGTGLHRLSQNLDQPWSPVVPFDEARWIDHLISDGSGNIWTAIWEKGLFRYDQGSWKTISAPDRIASNQVVNLLADRFNPGAIWVATNRGISRFDGANWHPLAMPKEIQVSREGATLRQSSDGALWVNSASRNWYFRKRNDFKVTNDLRDAFKTIRYQLDPEPPAARITLENTQITAPANLLVRWEGVDKWSKTAASLLKFSYRLDDGPWGDFSAQTSTFLFDLSPGAHRFHVKAMDLDGNISPASSAGFEVFPQMWRQPWFLALCALVAALIIALVALLFNQRMRHIIQMDNFKIQFFTNMSHELRTPLTAVIGPIESQLEKLPENWNKKPLEVAHKNARKTLSLIDRILDYRNAESGQIKINLAHADFIETVREVVSLVKPLADEQSQILELHCNVESCLAFYDSEKIEHILNNLLSNAIKYTQELGKISVSVKISEFPDTLTTELTVEDNGRGIPPEKVGRIFDLFYRADNAPGSPIRGSGIGLAYTKKLVEELSGSTTVVSPITNVNGHEQGTRFIVTLPLPKRVSEWEHLHPSDAPDHLADEEFSADKPTILLAEDDGDISGFLAEELHDAYNVLQAKDGSEAFAIAQRSIPDLIITDVIMPKVDGKELCRWIKQDPLTCHIPLIMLTALKSEAHELEGLSLGADDYLAKPIRIPILKQRIHNHLEIRRSLHARVSKIQNAAQIEPSSIATNQIDEDTLRKAFAIVEKQMQDPLFDIETFAREMGMSRMTLYRKFKAITGESPSSFVRSIRMKTAAALLKSGEHTVSEISSMVGLNDLSSFSTTFKKYFDQSPREFSAQRRKKSDNS